MPHPGGGQRGRDDTSRNAGPTQVCWHPRTSFLKGLDKSLPITVIKLSHSTLPPTATGPAPGPGSQGEGVTAKYRHPGDPWESPRPLQGILKAETIFKTLRCHLLFSLSLSHRYMMEFSRRDVTCDDVISLMTTGMCACVFFLVFLFIYLFGCTRVLIAACGI